MQRLESTLSHLKSIAQSEKYARRRRAWTRKRDERSRKRERERFILKGTVFIWNESSIKVREEPGESGGDKQREEKVKRQLKTRKRNGMTEQGRDKKE